MSLPHMTVAETSLAVSSLMTDLDVIARIEGTMGRRVRRSNTLRADFSLLARHIPNLKV